MSSEAAGIPRNTLSGARRAIRMQFLNLGVISGVWGVHVPSVKAHFALGEAMLSMVLLAGGFGAVLSLFTAGRVIAALGPRRASVVASLLIGGAAASLLLLPNVPMLLLAMLVFGAGSSLFDVSINAEGTMLETLSGRTVMSGFHGMFSIGGMSGAFIAAAMLRAQVPPWLQLALAGAVVATVASTAARWMLPMHPPEPAAPGSEDGTQRRSNFAWPTGALLLLGLLIYAGMMSEGVMYDWSVLYLSQELGAPQAIAALGYASFSAAMAATRFGGDALRRRFDDRRILAAGATLAASAMALSLAVGNTAFAIVGFALVGVGLATVVPILFTAATLLPGVSRAAAIASVSSIGYLGFMLGPPVIGAIAQSLSLTLAMGVLVIASASLALGSSRIPRRGR